MKKKIKIIIICAAVVAVIGIGLVVLKTLLSSKSNEKVFYTANVETYENVIEISGTVAAAQEQTEASEKEADEEEREAERPEIDYLIVVNSNNPVPSDW